MERLKVFDENDNSIHTKTEMCKKGLRSRMLDYSDLLHALGHRVSLANDNRTFIIDGKYTMRITNDEYRKSHS